jgi:predicted nucleic acid-binding protein
VGLVEDVGHGPVAIDTAAFIYFMEEHDAFLPVIAPLFEAIDAGHVRAITSALTLLEVLVVPFRSGNSALASRYEQLLTRSRGLRMVELERDQLRAAAQLRAVHPSLRTPDAIQLAAAATHRCIAIVTNDRSMPELPGLRVLQLSSYRS